VLTFTSPSTANHFVALLDDESRKAASECVIAAIGHVTEDALAQLGLKADLVPQRATVQDLVTALVSRMSDQPKPKAKGKVKAKVKAKAKAKAKVKGKKK
jgi:uroporphyrinogen-III synthase